MVKDHNKMMINHNLWDYLVNNINTLYSIWIFTNNKLINSNSITNTRYKKKFKIIKEYEEYI